jgi:hypothetical protein
MSDEFVLSGPLKYICIILLYLSIFGSYYATSTFLASAAVPIGCERTGTLKVKCCQEHVINRTPSNPAGTIVNYCTDCDIGPYGEPNYQNCSERYIEMFELDPNPPPTKSPFGEHVQPGVIEHAQPLTEQDSTNIDENVPPQHEFTEQLSTSETLEGDNAANNEQDSDFSQQPEDKDNGEDKNLINKKFYFFIYTFFYRS